MERLHDTSNSPAQPASGACSSSAAQPASKKRSLDTDPSGGASGSAARPATLLEQVEQLGHYPKRCKKPVTDKERTENSLAEKIAKQWSKLSDTTKSRIGTTQAACDSFGTGGAAWSLPQTVRETSD